MSEIQLTATFPSIASEKKAEFTERARSIIEQVAAESGTLRYDWYMSPDGSRCVVRELYTDSQAVVSHVEHVGADLPVLAELGGGLQVDAFGEPSPELREMSAGFGAVWHPPLVV